MPFQGLDRLTPTLFMIGPFEWFHELKNESNLRRWQSLMIRQILMKFHLS